MQLARLVPVAVAVPLLLGACFRDRAGTAPKDPAAAAAGRFAAAAALAPDPLAFLPIDAELVLGFDGAQIVRSALWQRFEARVVQALGDNLAQVKAQCGYDPLTALRSVTAGIRIADEVATGVMVIRGLDRTKTLGCVETAWAGRKVTRLPGGYVRIEPTDSVPTVLAFIDAATLVMIVGSDASPAQLDAALAAGVPLRKSRAFAELWALVDAKQALWFVINGNLKALDQLAAIGARPRAIIGAVSLANGVAATGRARFETPEQAAQLAATVQGQLGVLRAFVDEAEVAAVGADLTARLSLSMQQVEMLVGMTGGVSGP